MKAAAHYFGGARVPLFGWLHQAEGPSRDTGVVLCPPLGYEYICSHRTYRVLAERLAAAGFCVLRFDYRSTGDSAGADADATVAGWLGDIQSAIGELRNAAGVRRIVLAGLRIGATLAACEAADSGGVDGLVLWGPCVSGRAFTREMQMLGGNADGPMEDGAEPAIEAAGFIYPPALVRDLHSLDLARLDSLPADDVLLIASDDGAPVLTVDKRLRALGARLTGWQPAGTRQLVRSFSYEVKVPLEIVDGIRDWMVARFDVATRLRRGRNVVPRVVAEIAPGVRETAVEVGERRLFGVLSEPAEGDACATAVLVLNTGVDHRVGISRMSVTAARRWAQCGYRVLRIDLAGIGDSPSADPATRANPYADSALQDVRDALAFLREQSAGVLVTGICSGAYTAIRCVLSGLDVAGVCAVNPQLYWRPGDSVVSFLGELDQLRELRRIEGSAGSLAKWRRVLTGKVSLVGVTQVIRKRLGAQLFGGEAVRRARQTRADLAALARSETRSLLIFGSRDPGLGYARDCLPRRSDGRAVRLIEIPNADHSFSSGHGRGQLVKLLTHHLTTTYQ
jgi:pimeloyl-ACP methyl ester carboxylesterase